MALIKLAPNPPYKSVAHFEFWLLRVHGHVGVQRAQAYALPQPTKLFNTLCLK